MDGSYKQPWQRDMEHRMRDPKIDSAVPRTASWYPTWTEQDKRSSYFEDADFGMNMSNYPSYPIPVSAPRRSIKPPSRQPSPPAMSRPQSLSSGMSSSIDSALLTPRDGFTISSQDSEPVKKTRPSRARRGPLTPKQRCDAAIIRSIGACKPCRGRKVKCDPSHRMPAAQESEPATRTSGASLSLPSLVLVVTILRRCMKQRFQCKHIWREVPSAPSPASSRQSCAWPRAGTPVGLGLISWLSSQDSAASPETNSVDSFQDDLSDSVYEYIRHSDETAEEIENARLEELLTAVRSLLQRLPDEVAFGLAVEIQSLYHTFFLKGASFTRTPYPRTPSSSNSHNPPATPINSSSSGSGQKRPSDNSPEGWSPSGNGGDGDNNRKRPRKSPSSAGRNGKRWACPYYLKEPHKYCVESEFGDYRKCARSPGFSEVHRVKQHLIDCHIAIYCPRCYYQFKTEEELDFHQVAPRECSPFRQRPTLEGLDKYQKRQLTPRDRRSEEERWQGLHRICYPGDPATPRGEYVHYSREYALLQHDVLAVLEDETRFPDNIDIQRMLQRVRDTFDRNATNSMPRLLPTGRSSLPPPPRAGDVSQSFTQMAPLHDSSSPWSPEVLQTDPVRGNAEIPILISHPDEEASPVNQNPELVVSPYMGYEGLSNFEDSEGEPQFDLDIGGFGS